MTLDITKSYTSAHDSVRLTKKCLQVAMEDESTTAHISCSTESVFSCSTGLGAPESS